MGILDWLFPKDSIDIAADFRRAKLDTTANKQRYADADRRDLGTKKDAGP